MNHHIKYKFIFFITTLVILQEYLHTTKVSLSLPIKITNQNTSSLINETNNNIRISGGIKSGKNVFHHFLDFNVPSNKRVYFDDLDKKGNILSIVKGDRKSVIEGEINSDKSLFILNKNGFIFKKNPNLNVFSKIVFATSDKILFSGYKNNIYNELNKVFPKGDPAKFIFNSTNKGKIEIYGNGHKILQPGSIFLPNFGTGRSDGIRVKDKATIYLAASSILLNGGKITAPSGKINIFSVESGALDFRYEKPYLDKSLKFGLLSLDNKSLIDSSGKSSGTTIYASTINLLNESLIIHSNPSKIGGSYINIFSNKLNILGQDKKLDSSLRFQTSRGIVSQTFDAVGADIYVKSDTINVDKSGGLITSTFGEGKGGNLSIKATDLNVGGGSAFGLNLIGSQILATSTKTGEGGNIRIDSNIKIQNGGFIAAAAFGEGNSGSLFVKSEDSVEVLGGIFNENENSFIPSSLSSTSIAGGKGGNLEINSKRIIVDSGGRIDASSFANGNAGSLEIEADSLTVNGIDKYTKTPSSIKSASDSLNPFLSRIFELPVTPSGNAGSLDIKARQILVDNGGEISVTSVGTGQSGNLNLTADLIQGDNGLILASTTNSNGGDINIDANLLTLRSSKVIANADRGRGGNIKISAGAYFPSSDNEIAATSKLGPQFDGSINIRQDQNQLTFPNELFVDNIPPQLTLAPCTSDSSTLNEQEGIGQHFESTQDRQLYVESLRQRLAIASQYVYLDTETGKLKPFRRWMGVQRTEDGNLEIVFSPSQSKVIQNLLSSDIGDCPRPS